MSGTEIEVPETMDANPAPGEDNAGDTRLSPREQIMASIAARREEQIIAENAQAAIYDREATDAGLNFPTEEPAPATPDAPVQPIAPAPVIPATTPSVATPSVRTIMVDGQQYAVTEDQANELMRLGMMANVALHQYQATPAPQQQTHQPAPEPARLPIDEARIRDTVRQMQYGGEDAAVEAFTGLVSDLISRVPAPVDQHAIVTRAVSEAQALTRLEAETATIRQEYPDIFADPQRTMLAKLNVDAIRARDVATGTRRSDLEIFREAGNAVYSALGKALPGADPAPQQERPVVSTPRQDVIERKRAAPRPTQSIDMRAPQPTVARPPTNSEIVDKMRLARGQPSMR